MCSRPKQARRAQRGFSYLLLLFAVALISAGLAAGGTVWSQLQRREREARLLWVGEQYRRALASYAAAGDGQYPQRLEDLLEDPRSAARRRHLRRQYEDPITRRADWGLLRDARGGIVGMHSQSDLAPLRSTTLPPGWVAGGAATRYADWVVVVQPQAALPRSGAAGPRHDPPRHLVAPPYPVHGELARALGR